MTNDDKKRDCLIESTENNPEKFFKLICQVFDEAINLAGNPGDRFFKIGDYPIRLRFAGSSLVSHVVPALEHLSMESCSTPALTVYLWDSVSTGTTMPEPSWSMTDYISRGEIKGYSNGNILASFPLGSCVLSILNIRKNKAFYWIKDARMFPYYESSSPLRTILHWWMRDHECQLIHAAAVGISKGGVLLVGKSGSGKSTTALNCLLSGMYYAGDDHVLLRREPSPFVYSIYNSVKLNNNFLRQFPELCSITQHSNSPDEEKTLVFLQQHYPDFMGYGFSIRAVLNTCYSGLSRTKLVPVSPVSVLKALAPSTIFQLPGAGSKDFQEMAKLTAHVPCFTLEAGSDLRRIPEVIMNFLSDV